MDDEDPRSRRSRLGLAALMLSAGSLHFLRPGPFVRIVPRGLPSPGVAVHLSGLAELGAGTLLLRSRTSRAGGLAAAAIMAAVFPANVQMAVDAGSPRSLAAGAAWLRLPLQGPLISWALAQGRPARPKAGSRRG